MFRRGRAYNEWLDPYGFDDGDGIGRSSFAPAPIGRRIRRAKTVFLQHLASVDTSAGPAKEEIIKFHLVPDMKKEFNKYVKEHGCTASQKKLTREEQDKINTRRVNWFLMVFSSVTVAAGSASVSRQESCQGARGRYLRIQERGVGCSKDVAASPTPLDTSKSLKRIANAAQLDEASVAGAASESGSLGKKKL